MAQAKSQSQIKSKSTAKKPAPVRSVTAALTAKPAATATPKAKKPGEAERIAAIAAQVKRTPGLTTREVAEKLAPKTGLTITSLSIYTHRASKQGTIVKDESGKGWTVAA
jgi:hypothetical protein